MDITYDPAADAAYLYVGQGTTATTHEISPGLIADYDSSGRIVGLEILCASKMLAPGEWLKAPLSRIRHADAAE